MDENDDVLPDLIPPPKEKLMKKLYWMKIQLAMKIVMMVKTLKESPKVIMPIMRRNMKIWKP
jgi:hypothetical protein